MTRLHPKGTTLGLSGTAVRNGTVRRQRTPVFRVHVPAAQAAPSHQQPFYERAAFWFDWAPVLLLATSALAAGIYRLAWAIR